MKSFVIENHKDNLNDKKIEEHTRKESFLVVSGTVILLQHTKLHLA